MLFLLKFLKLNSFILRGISDMKNLVKFSVVLLLSIVIVDSISAAHASDEANRARAARRRIRLDFCDRSIEAAKQELQVAERKALEVLPDLSSVDIDVAAKLALYQSELQVRAATLEDKGATMKHLVQARATAQSAVDTANPYDSGADSGTDSDDEASVGRCAAAYSSTRAWVAGHPKTAGAVGVVAAVGAVSLASDRVRGAEAGLLAGALRTVGLRK